MKPAAKTLVLETFESWHCDALHPKVQTAMPSPFLWQDSKTKWQSPNGSVMVPPQCATSDDERTD